MTLMYYYFVQKFYDALMYYIHCVMGSFKSLGMMVSSSKQLNSHIYAYRKTHFANDFALVDVFCNLELTNDF